MVNSNGLVADWLDDAKKNAGWLIVLGVVTVIAGFFSLVMPWASGVGVAVFVGFALVVGGVARLIAAFSAGSFGRGTLAFIDDALARMQRHHNWRLVVVLSILRALALDVRGQREAALDTLAETVCVAKARGLVRSFVDCGPRVKGLLDELSRRSDGGAYLESLRAAFDGVATRQGPTGADASGSIDPLSHRERETLELLAWRMTNKEIAARLSVSPAAVKKRLESIYTKLDAHNRLEAVTAAVHQGIIPPPTH